MNFFFNLNNPIQNNIIGKILIIKVPKIYSSLNKLAILCPFSFAEYPSKLNLNENWNKVSISKIIKQLTETINKYLNTKKYFSIK